MVLTLSSLQIIIMKGENERGRKVKSKKEFVIETYI
jgi:hypothetical protein